MLSPWCCDCFIQMVLVANDQQRRGVQSPPTSANKALGALDAASAALLKVGQKSWGAALRILGSLKVVQVVISTCFNQIWADPIWFSYFGDGFKPPTNNSVSNLLRLRQLEQGRPFWSSYVFLLFSTHLSHCNGQQKDHNMEWHVFVFIASRKSLWNPGHGQWFERLRIAWAEMLLPDETLK